MCTHIALSDGMYNILCHSSTTVQKQKTVTVYFTCEQLLPFDFAWQGIHGRVYLRLFSLPLGDTSQLECFFESIVLIRRKERPCSILVE